MSPVNADDLEPGRHYCLTCHRHTVWVALRGGKAQKCNECGCRFPCVGACKHEDCRAIRLNSIKLAA